MLQLCIFPAVTVFTFFDLLADTEPRWTVHLVIGLELRPCYLFLLCLITERENIANPMKVLKDKCELCNFFFFTVLGIKDTC